MSITPDVLIEKLISLHPHVTDRGARLLVAANPGLALDVINGDINSPRSGPPVGPDGEVFVTAPSEPHVEHDSSCHYCGGGGHPDGPCPHCATTPYW